jgi:hypothetical protein
MSANGSVVMLQQVQTYAELRKQVHDDLRIQHPEWVQPNGESPTCDSYETRLMELLEGLSQRQPNKSYNDHRNWLKRQIE